MKQIDSLQLKKVLFGAYGGFADKRMKKLENGSRFIVDRRTAGNIGADGQVYSSFCSMFLNVDADGSVELLLINLPLSPAVERWLGENAKSTRAARHIHLAPGEQSKLLDLAVKLEDITRPGRSYDTAHYKHSVPRVSRALKQLHRILDKAWTG